MDNEPSLHPWNKSHLIMMYTFNVLLFVEDFVEDFASMFIRDIGLEFSFMFGILVWFLFGFIK